MPTAGTPLYRCLVYEELLYCYYTLQCLLSGVRWPVHVSRDDVSVSVLEAVFLSVGEVVFTALLSFRL